MSHHELDVRGQLCPFPVIKTQSKVKQLEIGDTLDILCTDPGALHDIPSWCRVHGHELVNTLEQDNEITITIKVCGS